VDEVKAHLPLLAGVNPSDPARWPVASPHERSQPIRQDVLTHEDFGGVYGTS
jgi:hypothetical protein